MSLHVYRCRSSGFCELLLERHDRGHRVDAAFDYLELFHFAAEQLELVQVVPGLQLGNCQLQQEGLVVEAFDPASRLGIHLFVFELQALPVRGETR